MTILAVNTVACSIICIWATWCIFSPVVQDGVFGKALFATIAIAALSVVLGPGYGYDKPQAPGVTLHVCIAALGLRHIVMKHLWPLLMVKRGRA
jgi:hypothetical protein